jgi:predicted secreted protein
MVIPIRGGNVTTSDLSPEVADPRQGQRKPAAANTRGQRILLWTTPPAAALFVLAYFLFPVFSPPLSPTMTPEQVAAFFRDNNAGILGVVILGNLIACSLVPLFAVTAVQMSRTATSSSVFTYAYVISVGVGTTAFILADYCWGMAAFRPERDPQLISLLNDMAWFFFIAPVGTIAVQSLCLAVSVYLDGRSDPIFPRWFAHFNVVAAVLLLPSAFSILNKTGPLAWDGAVSFTLRLAVLAVYVAVTFVVLVGVVNRQGSERDALA